MARTAKLRLRCITNVDGLPMVNPYGVYDEGPGNGARKSPRRRWRHGAGMRQADLGLDLRTRKTCKGKPVDETDRVVPWAQLFALIEWHAPRKQRGRPSFSAEATPAANGLTLEEGAAVDASPIATPGSTKNTTGTRDPQPHQTRKGHQWYFGMKYHIGVDSGSRRMRMAVATSADLNDVPQPYAPVHGEQSDAFADAGYRGGNHRHDTRDLRTHGHFALRPCLRRLLDATKPTGALAGPMEQVNASIRAKVAHPFRVIRRPPAGSKQPSVSASGREIAENQGRRSSRCPHRSAAAASRFRAT